MAFLALEYASTYLIFDLLSCLSGLLIAEKSRTSYILQFFRLFRVTRILFYMKKMAQSLT